MSSTKFILPLAILLGACGNDSASDSPSEPEVADRLHLDNLLADLQIGRPDSVIYAFRYSDALPQQHALVFNVFDPILSDSGMCSLYSPNAQEHADDLWHVAVSLGGHANGLYHVTRAHDSAEDPQSAVVAISSGDVSYPALSGTVEVTSAPASDTAAADGAPLQGTLRVELPWPLIRTRSCRVEKRDLPDAPPHTECECETSEGRVQICFSTTPGNEDCCLEGIRETRQVEVKFDAPLCPGMCSSDAPSLASRCASPAPMSGRLP